MTRDRRTAVLSPPHAVDRVVDHGGGLPVGGSGQIELSTALLGSPTASTGTTITTAAAAPAIISLTCRVLHRIHSPY